MFAKIEPPRLVEASLVEKWSHEAATRVFAKAIARAMWLVGETGSGDSARWAAFESIAIRDRPHPWNAASPGTPARIRYRPAPRTTMTEEERIKTLECDAHEPCKANKLVRLVSVSFTQDELDHHIKR